MHNQNLDILYNNAVSLLKKLIATPSFSKEEEERAEIIDTFLNQKVLLRIIILTTFGQRINILMKASQPYYSTRTMTR